MNAKRTFFWIFSVWFLLLAFPCVAQESQSSSEPPKTNDTLFIAGNHDACLCNATINGLPANVHYLCYSGVEIEGLRFWGISMLLTDVLSGKYLSEIKCIPDGTDVLITHEPPFDILDEADSIHYGNQELLERVKEIMPQYHLFGHVHANYGLLKQNDVVYSNASLFSEYNQLNNPRLFLLQ